MIGKVLGKLEAADVPGGIELRRGRWVPWLGGMLAGMRRPASAVTLRRTIVLHPGAPLTERLLQHELAHVRQWRADPLLFPLRYAWAHLRHGYRDNPYEVEARAAESAPSGPREGAGERGRGQEQGAGETRPSGSSAKPLRREAP